MAIAVCDKCRFCCSTVRNGYNQRSRPHAPKLLSKKVYILAILYTFFGEMFFHKIRMNGLDSSIN